MTTVPRFDTQTATPGLDFSDNDQTIRALCSNTAGVATLQDLIVHPGQRAVIELNGFAIAPGGRSSGMLNVGLGVLPHDYDMANVDIEAWLRYFPTGVAGVRVCTEKPTLSSGDVHRFSMPDVELLYVENGRIVRADGVGFDGVQGKFRMTIDMAKGILSVKMPKRRKACTVALDTSKAVTPFVFLNAWAHVTDTVELVSCTVTERVSKKRKRV